MTKTVKSPVSHEFGMNNPASSEATGPPVGGPPNGPNLNNSLGNIFLTFLSAEFDGVTFCRVLWLNGQSEQNVY